MIPARLTVRESVSISDALNAIQANQHGLVLVADKGESILGIATDGDIRRAILQGISLDRPIGSICNREYVWADKKTPRENILKLLDHKIRIIPLLNENKQLVDIITHERVPSIPETSIYACARSPARVSFGGGGSDLTHFFINQSGAVISSTISLYSYATLKVRKDEKILIRSRDLGNVLEAQNLLEALANKGPFRLIQALLKMIQPEYGFELYLHSDFPIGSGIGGSAVLSSAILGCFNQFRTDRWDQYELAELAFQAERLHLGIGGGWQDQYATVFGGFNFMEFNSDQHVISSLRIPPEILNVFEESLVLCHTGVSHDSGDIHSDQKVQMSQKDIQDLVAQNVKLTYLMRNQLLRGKLAQFGESFHEAWLAKRRFSQKISNNRLDEIYQGARDSGALGGKILGAGGGGYFLFQARPFHKLGLMDYLQSVGMRLQPFHFDNHGLKSWSVRHCEN